MKNPADYAGAFVGSLLLKPESVLKIAQRFGLTSAHFTNADFQEVFEAAMRLNEAGKVLDTLTIATESKVPIPTIQRLIDDCPTWTHAEFYAKQIQFSRIKQLALIELQNATDELTLDNAATLIHDSILATSDGGTNNGFTIRTWGECVDMDLPPKEYFFGNLFACGQVNVIFGQGGLGKSRIVANLARNQVLGIPFLDENTGTKPLRHLFIGSENDIHRWQIDARAMSRGLSAAQIERLAAHIRMSTIERGEDIVINLDDAHALERWKRTLAAWPPDVLFIDPWGDIVQGEGFDKDVRQTIRTLQKLASAVNPDCGIVILAHSRTGSANIAQAAGFDSANFGKDSKALYSTARAVVNVAPFDQSENPDLCWIPAKNNNGRKTEPKRIALDPDNLTYSVVETLDVDEWQRTVKMAGSFKGGRKEQFDSDKVKALFETDSPMCKVELEHRVIAMGVTVRATRAGISGMIRKGTLIEKPAGKRNQKLIGTPEAFENEF